MYYRLLQPLSFFPDGCIIKEMSPDSSEVCCLERERSDDDSGLESLGSGNTLCAPENGGYWREEALCDGVDSINTYCRL